MIADDLNWPPQDAVDHIVDHVVAGIKPRKHAVDKWLAGGAAFWSPQHFTFGHPIDFAMKEDCPTAAGTTSRDKFQFFGELRIWVCEEFDGGLTPRFASITLESSQKITAYAVTHFDQFIYGDTLVRFVRDLEYFKQLTTKVGFMWFDSPPDDNEIGNISDEALDYAYRISRARRRALRS